MNRVTWHEKYFLWKSQRGKKKRNKNRIQINCFTLFGYYICWVSLIQKKLSFQPPGGALCLTSPSADVSQSNRLFDWGLQVRMRRKLSDQGSWLDCRLKQTTERSLLFVPRPRAHRREPRRSRMSDFDTNPFAEAASDNPFNVRVMFVHVARGRVGRGEPAAARKLVGWVWRRDLHRICQAPFGIEWKIGNAGTNQRTLSRKMGGVTLEGSYRKLNSDVCQTFWSHVSAENSQPEAVHILRLDVSMNSKSIDYVLVTQNEDSQRWS